MTPRQQGVFIGLTAAGVTGMIALLLPPLPSNLLFLGCALYGCGLAWAILRWSYRLASNLPLEEGIPKHLQGVLLGVLFLAGSTTIANLEIHPSWVKFLVELGYLLAASQGVMRWNAHKPRATSTSR